MRVLKQLIVLLHVWMIELINSSEFLPKFRSLLLWYLPLDHLSFGSTLFMNAQGLLPHWVPAELPIGHFEHIFNLGLFLVKNGSGGLLLR